MLVSSREIPYTTRDDCELLDDDEIHARNLLGENNNSDANYLFKKMPKYL